MERHLNRTSFHGGLKSQTGMSSFCELTFSKRTFKQQITLRMVFIKYNCLQPNIFFNRMFIPCFSGSIFFRVPVHSSGSSFRSGSVFSGWRFMIQVQGLGPGFISSVLFIHSLFWIDKFTDNKTVWNKIYCSYDWFEVLIDVNFVQ